MPKSSDFEKVHSSMLKKYGKEKGEQVYQAWLNKNKYDDTKSLDSQKKSEDNEYSDIIANLVDIDVNKSSEGIVSRFEVPICKSFADGEDLYIAGYASVAEVNGEKVFDRQGEHIPLEALKEAVPKWMSDKEYNLISMIHKDIPVAKAVDKVTSPDGTEYKTGVDDNGFFLVSKIRNSSYIAPLVHEMIENGSLGQYSVSGKSFSQKVNIGGGKTIVPKFEILTTTLAPTGSAVNPYANVSDIFWKAFLNDNKPDSFISNEGEVNNRKMTDKVIEKEDTTVEDKTEVSTKPDENLGKTQEDIVNLTKAQEGLETKLASVIEGVDAIKKALGGVNPVEEKTEPKAAKDMSVEELQALIDTKKADEPLSKEEILEAVKSDEAIQKAFSEAAAKHIEEKTLETAKEEKKSKTEVETNTSPQKYGWRDLQKDIQTNKVKLTGLTAVGRR